MSCTVIEDVNTDEDYELQPYAQETTNLSQRIQSELWNGQYECAICTEGISRDSPLWSCKNCYYAFHFPCLNSWAGSSASGEWFCPTCKDKNQGVPEARCWCGRMSHRNLEIQNGNSCQAVCEKSVQCDAKKSPCVRACTDLCHPGPCELPEKCLMLYLKAAKENITVQATTTPSPRATLPSMGPRIHVVESASTGPYHSRNTRTPSNRRTANASRYAAPRPPPTRSAQAQNNQRAAGATAPGQDATFESNLCLTIFATILQAGVQCGFVALALDHTQWWNKPLKYRKFTEKLQNVELGVFITLCILLSPILLMLQVLCFMAWVSYLRDLFKLRDTDALVRSGWKQFMRILLYMFFGVLCAAGFFSLPIMWAAGPSVGWKRQMGASCKISEGFDTRVTLDTYYWGYRPADAVFLYNPADPDRHMREVTGMDHFNTSTPVDYNVPPTEPFYTFSRLTGTLLPGHHLAADFDLKYRAWRISTISYNGSLPINVSQATRESWKVMSVIRNGTWSPTSPANPHLNFPSLGLQLPNMHYFTKNCQYQPFVTVFRTDGMLEQAIRKQSDKDWRPKSADNLVMRTAIFGGSTSEALNVCARRGEYLVKGNGGAGVQKRKGLGEDIVVPLGLIVSLRKQMGSKLYGGCGY